MKRYMGDPISGVIFALACVTTLFAMFAVTVALYQVAAWAIA